MHVLMDGRIVRSGDAELAKQIEADGYDPFIDGVEAAGRVAP